MLYKKYSAAIVFLLFSFVSIEGKSQSKRTNRLTSNVVTEVSYSRCCGGESGYYFNFTMFKDSIVYETGLYFPDQNKNKKIYKSTTPAFLWDSLKKLININEFKKIKSNRSNQEADGSDTELKIIEDAKIYSVINAQFDRTDRTKTSLLFLFIEKIYYKFSKKAENK